jgi:type IV secretory pathway VirB9-like protein
LRERLLHVRSCWDCRGSTSPILACASTSSTSVTASKGDDPPWRSLRAFDDGRKVNIQMPSGLPQGEAPLLFMARGDGRPNLVIYRVRGTYYIVEPI